MKYSIILLLNARKFAFVVLCALTVSVAFGQNLEPNDDCSKTTFNAGKVVLLDAPANKLVSADFNNDGKRDVAVGISRGFSTSRIEILLGDAAGGFVSADSISIPDYLSDLKVGDFNGDGNLDLLLTHRLSSPGNGIELLAGDGGGNFTKSKSISFDGEMTALAVGDFNGDDRADFAVTDAQQNRVVIYYGEDSDNFSKSDSFSLGIAPSFAGAGDFDNDGKSDLIVVGSTSSFVTVLLSAANGGFNSPVSFSLAENANAGDVAVGDINGDGKIDAVVGSTSTNLSGISILIGDGAGKFSLQPFMFSNTGTYIVSLADVNNDGQLDIIGGANQSASAIRLGNGDGTFAAELTFASAGFVVSQSIDDFDGDGKADLIQNAGSLPEFQLFFGAGNGHFGASSIKSGGQPNSTVTADFNNDGKPDLAVSNYDSSNVSVLTNDGVGGLTVTSTIALPERPHSIFSADFDGDGKQDIGTIDWQTGTVAGRLAIMLNNGSGFSEPVLYSVGSRSFLRAVAVGDINGDKILDIAVAVADSPGSLVILAGTGTGTFYHFRTLNVGQSGYYYYPSDVAIADLNRDGKNDIVVAAAGALLVYLNSENGIAAQSTFYQVANLPVADIALADFNHDGILDAAVTNNAYNANPYNFVPSLSVLLGTAAGGFGTAKTYQTGRGASSVAAADFNNDGNFDIAFTNGYNSSSADNHLGIIYGDGAGEFSGLQRFIAGQNSFDISTADFNGDGRLDIATPNYRNDDVSILLNACSLAAPSGFPALTVSDDVTVTETDAGTIDAVFTVTLSAPSSRQVRVDYYTTAGTANGSADY